jgi:hypothetical protein
MDMWYVSWIRRLQADRPSTTFLVGFGGRPKPMFGILDSSRGITLEIASKIDGASKHEHITVVSSNF